MKSQQPAMQKIPPETIEKRMLVSAASAPASTFPSVGALATWASSIPDRRPRRESGVTVSRIVERRIALQSSAAPAIARKSRASHRVGENPKPTIAAPHAEAATQTPRPCLRARVTQPERSVAARAPAYGAAYREPTVDAPPPKCSPIAGKSALGIPNTIAIESTTK